VARRAFAGALEIRAARGRVAGGEVCGLDGATPAAEFGELIHLGMQERDDRIQLTFCKVGEGGHAVVRPAGPNDRGQLIASRVLRHQFSAREVGAGLTARSVLTVAEAALRPEPHFALPNLVGGIVLRGRGLRSGLGGRALGARRFDWRERLRIRRLAEGERSESENRDNLHSDSEMISGPVQSCCKRVERAAGFSTIKV
jgi:hypothetical protein